MQRELREADPRITGITVNRVQSLALAFMIDESRDRESCSRDETKLRSRTNEPRMFGEKEKSRYTKKFLGELIIVVPGILK